MSSTGIHWPWQTAGYQPVFRFSLGEIVVIKLSVRHSNSFVLFLRSFAPTTSEDVMARGCFGTFCLSLFQSGTSFCIFCIGLVLAFFELCNSLLSFPFLAGNLCCTISNDHSMSCSGPSTINSHTGTRYGSTFPRFEAAWTNTWFTDM
jgi:hypothetical protein